MAAISVFSPSIDEKRWVSHSSRAIDSELKIEIDSIPTIFQVPKATNETKPEAYTPQIVGLGPYHHLRPELYNAHRQKLAGVKNFLKSRKFSDRIKDLEPVVRANYDNYLDLEGTTLESIVAIDSFYLLDFLGSYDEKTEAENLEPGHLELAKDVIMLENQIPAFALAEMGKELDLFSPTKGTEETMLYSQLFYYFCKAHSPLELAELSEIRSSKSKHLLAHLYHLIVNPGPGIATVLCSGFLSEISESIEKGIDCLKILREVGLGGAMINPLLFAFVSLQVLEKSKLAEELTKDKQQKPKIQKIEIPSASELSKKHNVKFLNFHVGFRELLFESGEMILPAITLRRDSEVVLRNLIAYEVAVMSTFELAEYVDLMCGLVHTPKDMALLRESRIIKGDLNDEQVAKMFNGISRCVAKSKESSPSQKVVKEVKEMVEKWENQKLCKRVKRFLEKIFKIGVQFLRKPFGIAMKYLTFMFFVLLLVLQILQAYCQVYGCNMGGSKANAVSLMMSD